VERLALAGANPADAVTQGDAIHRPGEHGERGSREGLPVEQGALALDAPAVAIGSGSGTRTSRATNGVRSATVAVILSVHGYFS
jgi:hypothetical protein